MKKKKLAAFVAVIMTVVFVFAACGSGSELVGSWQGSGRGYHFNSNGTGHNESFHFTWNISGERLIIEYDNGHLRFYESFDVIDGRLLILNDGNRSWHFHRIDEMLDEPVYFLW